VYLRQAAKLSSNTSFRHSRFAATQHIVQLTPHANSGSLAYDSRSSPYFQEIAMNKKTGSSLSRRQFARRAAVASAAAALVPAQALLPSVAEASSAQDPQNTPKLSPEGQLEAASRYQQILALYGPRFSDTQKAELKKISAELQPALEKVRKFSLENGNSPALYLKPLVEREKKSRSAAAPTKH
jgi:hypothetical protein